MRRTRSYWLKLIERSEQAAFGILYLNLLIKFWPDMWEENAGVMLLYVLDQTILLVFLLTRRAAVDMSDRPGDHVIAIGSTVLPLLAVPNSGENLLPLPLLMVMVMAGILCHLLAKFTLRRSFGILPANRGIKSGGAYRYVRHPMYLGYLVVQLGLILAGPVAWNVALFLVGSLLFVFRISAEERLLEQSEDYRAFCRSTRYRLIPGLY